jgi:hypothetical protein
MDRRAAFQCAPAAASLAKVFSFPLHDDRDCEQQSGDRHERPRASGWKEGDNAQAAGDDGEDY